MSEIRFGSGTFSSMLERQILGRESAGASALGKNDFAKGIPQASEATGTSFAETLKSAIHEVNEMQLQADSAAKDFVKGKNEIHDVMIAMEKAELSLRTLTSVRGKLIEAYQEIIRMPV